MNEPETRNQRRFVAKQARRAARKAARAALHGLPRKEAPPSLLQSLRMDEQIKKAKSEVDALLSADAAPVS